MRPLKAETTPKVHHGDLLVTNELSITGTVTGTIYVHSEGLLVLMGVAEEGVVVLDGGYARISGTTGRLLVGPGGRATLTGTARGAVTNDGGRLVIDGTVHGRVSTRSGETSIAPNASVSATYHRLDRSILR
jgi:cytoskeletal protein CcmA (bactofilin family)